MTEPPLPKEHAPQAYAQPYTYAWSPRTNGFAIASLVCGIVNMGIGSVLALVFGYIAKREIDASNGTQGGRGLAIVGIVLGWIGVGIWLLVILVLLIFGLVALLAGVS